MSMSSPASDSMASAVFGPRRVQPGTTIRCRLWAGGAVTINTMPHAQLSTAAARCCLPTATLPDPRSFDSGLLCCGGTLCSAL